VLDFASIREVNMTVIPYKKYPLAEEDAPWDGPREVAAADVEDLKIMCTFYRSEDPDVKSSYSLPHHRQKDYYTVWRGVAGCMGALLGARGGVNIPDQYRKGCYNHIAKHYADFDKEPPEFKSLDSAREVRSCEMQMRAEKMDNGMPKLVGCAAVFGKQSEDLGGYTETIKPGAFTESLKRGDDVCALWNHDSNYVLGRTKNDTLLLDERNDGLYCEITLPDTSIAHDALTLIENGYVNQMSFGFMIDEEKWNDSFTEREIVKASLFDVSPVAYPAYPQTSVGVSRSFMLSIYDPPAKPVIERANNISNWLELVKRF